MSWALVLAKTRPIVQDKNRGEGEKNGKEMFYLTTHSTHFIYGYMASDIGKGPFR